MKCGNFRRFVWYGMLAWPQVGELSAARAPSYVCPHCEYPEMRRSDRRQRSIPVAFDRRVLERRAVA